MLLVIIKEESLEAKGEANVSFSPPCLRLKPHTHQPAVRQLRQPRDIISSYPCPALFAYLWTSFVCCAQATLCNIPQATNLRSICNRLCSVLTVRILLPPLLKSDPSLLESDPSLLESDPSLVESDPLLLESDSPPLKSDLSLLESDPSLL